VWCARACPWQTLPRRWRARCATSCERLIQGESPDEILAYFASRYGEWVLLTPPARGFALVAWLAPLGALVGGLGVAVLVLRRWTRRAPGAVARSRDDEVDAEALAAVRREMDRRRG
jgi:cytochrome c-type biogenesis protein CcmH